MALKTGEKVERPYNQIDREETVFLNETEVQGRTVQPQNKPMSITLQQNLSGTTYGTVTETMIITGVQFSAYPTDASGPLILVIVYVKDERVGMLVEYTLLSRYEQFVNLPNLKLEPSEQVAVSVLALPDKCNAFVLFTGYKA